MWCNPCSFTATANAAKDYGRRKVVVEEEDMIEMAFKQHQLICSSDTAVTHPINESSTSSFEQFDNDDDGVISDIADSCFDDDGLQITSTISNVFRNRFFLQQQQQEEEEEKEDDLFCNNSSDDGFPLLKRANPIIDDEERDYDDDDCSSSSTAVHISPLKRCRLDYNKYYYNDIDNDEEQEGFSPWNYIEELIHDDDYSSSSSSSIDDCMTSTTKEEPTTKDLLVTTTSSAPEEKKKLSSFVTEEEPNNTTTNTATEYYYSTPEKLPKIIHDCMTAPKKNKKKNLPFTTTTTEDIPKAVQIRRVSLDH